MRTLKKKTVFFLGAGFSKAAGAPAQNELLSQVLDYSGYGYGNPVAEYQNYLKLFFHDAFKLSDEQMCLFSLEDFFTPIDKCISENTSFRGYSVDAIKSIRNYLSILVSIVINDQLQNSDRPKDYIDTFVNYILALKKNAPTVDKVSIITTNWDILLDRRFFESLNHSYDNRGTIDFGTHVVSLSAGQAEQIMPAMIAIAKKLITVKLYKIHGSLNWLKCPSCNRLYVNPDTKIGIPAGSLGIECRFCDQSFILPSRNLLGIKLEPQLIYPTFVKDFSNVHFQRIWDNVSTELSEASRIVFIGYSFPQADYEIRQLLARKVPDNCEIVCVLYGDEPEREDRNYYLTEQARYENFFGGRVKIFNYQGAREYIQKIDTYDY